MMPSLPVTQPRAARGEVSPDATWPNVGAVTNGFRWETRGWLRGEGEDHYGGSHSETLCSLEGPQTLTCYLSPARQPTLLKTCTL